MKPNLNKIRNLTSSVVNLACWDDGINSALDDFYEHLKAQDTDSEKESIEKSNFDTLISNSIHTLIWAHRMHSLLQHYKSELDANPTEKYKMCLEFEEDMKNLFDQQYKYLKHYAENIKNENLFFQSHRGLEVINSLYK